MRLKFSLILAIFSTNVALKLIVKFTKTIISQLPKKQPHSRLLFCPILTQLMHYFLQLIHFYGVSL